MKLSAKVIEADMTIFDEEAIEAAAPLVYMARGYAPACKKWEELTGEIKREWYAATATILQTAIASLRARGMVFNADAGKHICMAFPVAIIQIKEPTA